MNKEIELDQRSERARRLLTCLKNKGLSIPQIAQLLGNGIDKRTLYRWLNGDAKPQRSQDLDRLQELVDKL